jgi:D-alanine transaminase/branched-chain amino acid aminotransferase
MKALLCYQDGQFKDYTDLSIPAADLGVQRGYGIFDYLRTAEQHAHFLDDHLDRFFASADAMHLPVSISRKEIIDIVQKLMQVNQLAYSGIKILLTGGDANDGYTIQKSRLSIFQQTLIPPSIVLPEKGIHLVSREYQRQLPHVKTTDYLMVIWLQPWLKEQGGDDILYYNQETITECPRSNIFMVTHQNKLVTPKSQMLQGITRKKIIQLAATINMEVEERNIPLQELYTAKEIFISSSTKRILPVSKLDNQYQYEVSYFEFTKQLWDAFLNLENDISVI